MLQLNRHLKGHMKTSSNADIFCVTGPLWGEPTGHRWTLLTKASDAELWCFLWSAPEQTVIWDAITLIMTSQWGKKYGGCIQSSAIITRSNLSRYYTRHCDYSKKRKSNFKLKTATPYLALTGELWGVYYENFEENWPRYNGTVLYCVWLCLVVVRPWSI